MSQELPRSVRVGYGLGSVATVQRRLRHLKQHGAIQQKPCEHESPPPPPFAPPRPLSLKTMFST